MEKYQNKYRIPSARMPGYDYGQNGAYFITICTHNREHYFGSIINHQMVLNQLGLLAEKFWHEIPQHFPFVRLGNFVVMPNHVHGILVIDNNGGGDIVETLHCNVFIKNDDDISSEMLDCNVSIKNDDDISSEMLDCNVSIKNDDDIPSEMLDCNVSIKNDDDISSQTLHCNVSTGKNEHMAKISPHAGSISTIIRSYKSVVSKNARFIHATFAWQARFHDHIIRNDISYERIQQYILTNPQNWDADSLNA